jgi:iron complex outermembrane receptor protein
MNLKNIVTKGCLAIALFCINTAHAQFKIAGTVLGPNQKPIPYAAIAIKNTFISTMANGDGQFEIKNLKSGKYTLITHGVGYKQRVDTINLFTVDVEIAVVLKNEDINLDEIVVNSTRADKQSGMAYTVLNKEDIEKSNLGQDVPMILNTAPSVVVNTDAGNGVGYTGLRIRGTDGTRINVTINGIPVNDAESQGTFFVNTPDLLSSVNSIQVQRGVGASSNGAGAFGGSINMQTNTLNEKPYAQLINSGGSYNTYRNTIAAGSGLISNHFAFDARLSRIGSDGYIDRAKSTLNSYYLSGGYYSNKTVVKAIMFSGNEKTYQAWYYVPEDSIKRGNRTYNPAGEYLDANGKVRYYNNETDNYKQDNYQIHLIQTINDKLNFTLAGHYTEGKGYYEQYRSNDALANYGIADVVIDSITTITNSDLIRRRWLDNDFIGAVGNFNYTPSSKVKFTLGGGTNQYFGRHMGEVIWARYSSNSDIGKRYYYNRAFKNDNNVYLKSNINFMKNASAFIDLQYRNVFYSFLGFDSTLASAQQSVKYDFFNPKVGLNYNISEKIRVYASYAIANKEPNRDDFTQSSIASRPKHESLNDLEIGGSFSNKDIFFEATIYNMDYTNQLVLNGAVNDVGAYNRVNVKKSYRRGIELQAAVNITKYFTLSGNVTLSKNKIKDYVEFLDSASADYSVYKQMEIKYSETDISFSPNITSCGIITFKAGDLLNISLINKYVGRQYLDNTSNVNRSINPYSVFDVKLTSTIKTKWIKEIMFMVSANNILSTKYETNGYTFSYYTDTTLNTFNYLSPAAPFNVLGGVSLKF